MLNFQRTSISVHKAIHIKSSIHYTSLHDIVFNKQNGNLIYFLVGFFTGPKDASRKLKSFFGALATATGFDEAADASVTTAAATVGSKVPGKQAAKVEVGCLDSK